MSSVVQRYNPNNNRLTNTDFHSCLGDCDQDAETILSQISFNLRNVDTRISYRSRNANALSVGQASYIFPVNFLISKARPTMWSTLLQKFIHCATLRCFEQEFTSNTIIILSRSRTIHLLQEVSRSPIASILSIMPIKITDSVSRFIITPPQQLLLYRLFTRTMCLLCVRKRTNDGVRFESKNDNIMMILKKWNTLTTHAICNPFSFFFSNTLTTHYGLISHNW